MRAESAQFAAQPVISIVTPVHDTDPRWLRACIASVRNQAYPHWELCLCDDASTRAETRQVLAGCTDARIRIVRLYRNAHISAASNAALALATGEFVGFLDHDDELTPDALFEVVALLNRAPDADVVYSDEDKRDADGGLSDPYFKPDWSPEHLLSAMYTCHFTVVRRAAIDRAGGFRAGYEGSQDHDLMLRLAEATDRIHHLPRVLYHWRRTPESTASTGTEKSWAHEAGIRALEDCVRRRGWHASVVTGGVPGLYRVRFAVCDHPLVSIVIVNAAGTPGAAASCADRVRAVTSYAPIEIVASNETGPATTREVQSAVRRTQGRHVVILDASLTPEEDAWLEALLEYSQQEPIGAVGAKIRYGDGRLRHVGLLLGVGDGIARAMHGWPADAYGYFSGAIGVRNYSVVSGECLMTRRDVFDRVGGFDEALPWSVADVDYCLRTRADGRRVVFTPYADLRIRDEAAAPPIVVDRSGLALVRTRWTSWFERDPQYNPNLSRQTGYELGD